MDNYAPSVSVSASVGRPSSGPSKKKNPHITMRRSDLLSQITCHPKAQSESWLK